MDDGLNSTSALERPAIKQMCKWIKQSWSKSDRRC